MPRTLLSVVLSILVALALAPAVAAAPVPPLDTGRSPMGDHDDARDDDHDDRSGHGGGDRDDDDDDDSDSDDSDDDCSRPRDVDDDDDEVVISGPIPSGTTVIDVFDDDCFTPDAATIDLGGSVTFVNHHSDEHTATGSAFDTGRIDTGETATVTLDTPGTFAFGLLVDVEQREVRRRLFQVLRDATLEQAQCLVDATRVGEPSADGVERVQRARSAHSRDPRCGDRL